MVTYDFETPYRISYFTEEIDEKSRSSFWMVFRMRTTMPRVSPILVAAGLTMALISAAPAAGQPPGSAAPGSAAASAPLTPPPQAQQPSSAAPQRAPAKAQPVSDTDPRGPYVIGPEDVLVIKVWNEGNLSGPVIVGPDGMISMQLIHEVKAEGLTPKQLETEIARRLQETAIKNPEVNVEVQAVRSRKFTIQGGVSHPGTFPLTGPITVLEALVYGGSFREFSNSKKIYILRKVPGGGVKKLNFNYKEVSRGRHLEQNILVQNGDQIFVPE
jgi:polysaccharide export outer membrane protein